MKVIDLQFFIENEVQLTEPTVTDIKKHYDSIPPIKLNQLWDGVPERVKLSIDVSGVCISLFDDWICTLFGNSYNDCLVALCSFHSLLVGELGKKVTFKIIQPTRELNKLIISQRWRRWLIRICWITLGIFLTLVIAGIYQWVQAILQQRGAP